jgi:pullulanase
VEKAVHAVNPDAVIYGEGWTMGSTINGSLQANQQNIGKIEPAKGAAGAVAVFNDAIRDGLKGSVFEKTSQGYISGDYRNNQAKVQFGIRGGTGTGATWSVKRGAVINYMSAHDNHTLWDKLALSNAGDSVEARLAMNRLGAGILMISKGTPFWQAGEEMLRTKGGDENSYKSSDAVNNIDWEALVPGSNEYEMMTYYKGLIEMRAAYDVFRSGDETSVSFENLKAGGMVAKFADRNGVKAIVLINPTFAADSYAVSGNWKLVANGTTAGAEVIETANGTLNVAGRSVSVYVK